MEERIPSSSKSSNVMWNFNNEVQLWSWWPRDILSVICASTKAGVWSCLKYLVFNSCCLNHLKQAKHTSSTADRYYLWHLSYNLLRWLHGMVYMQLVQNIPGVLQQWKVEYCNNGDWSVLQQWRLEYCNNGDWSIATIGASLILRLLPSFLLHIVQKTVSMRQKAGEKPGNEANWSQSRLISNIKPY